MVQARPCFGLERVWLAADALWPPFVNQLVVEGEGSLAVRGLREAMDTLLPLWPGARARCVGVLGGTRWSADGEPPRVRAVEDAWDGLAAHSALTQPLDPFAGPIVELVSFPGRLLVRTHHAAFDGRAAWAWVADLGRVLRGESPRGSRFAALVEPSGGAPTPEPPADAPLPAAVTANGPAAGPAVWARRTLPSAGRALLPRTLVAVAETVGAPVRLSVPMDLRRHLAPKIEAACANLTGFVRVDVAPGDEPGVVAAAVELAIAQNADLGSVRAADGLRRVPLWLMRASGKASAKKAFASGRAPVTGTVSNLGRADERVLDHAGFQGRACYWLPPANPGSPLFVTLTGHRQGVELVVGMPPALGGGGEVDRFTGVLAQRLAAVSS